MESIILCHRPCVRDSKVVQLQPQLALMISNDAAPGAMQHHAILLILVVCLPQAAELHHSVLLPNFDAQA